MLLGIYFFLRVFRDCIHVYVYFFMVTIINWKKNPRENVFVSSALVYSKLFGVNDGVIFFWDQLVVWIRFRKQKIKLISNSFPAVWAGTYRVVRKVVFNRLEIRRTANATRKKPARLVNTTLSYSLKCLIKIRRLRNGTQFSSWTAVSYAPPPRN